MRWVEGEVEKDLIMKEKSKRLNLSRSYSRKNRDKSRISKRGRTYSKTNR